MTAEPLRLGRRTFAPDEFAVMAIVNRTPDSFYDRGATYADAAALDALDRAVAEGADIVDIGGVQSGYGEPVTETEELRRTVSFVAQVRSRHPELVISVDTWRAGVARQVCEAGADLVNDAWSAADPEIIEVAAEYGAGLVCSHTGGIAPRSEPHRVAFGDIVADVVETVTRLAEHAVGIGVRRDGIVIDPTHDSGKNSLHSIELTRRLGELVATGWPVLLAVSNKDFIGEILDAPRHDRLAGTLAATAVAAAAGARVFRAHDVRETRQVLDLVTAVEAAGAGA